MTKTAPFFPADFFEYEMGQDLEANDEKMDAAERNLRVLINTHAVESREARRQAAERKAKAARQRARVHAYYRRIAYCVLTAAATYILTLTGAVSPVIALVVACAALFWMAQELYWIARKTIRFWTRKGAKHHA